MYKAVLYTWLIAPLLLAVIVFFHAGHTNREYLCTESCSYIEYNAFLGLVFLSLLFIASISLIRLLMSDQAFGTWKKFMKVFTPLGLALALLIGLDSGGGSWGPGGVDGEIVIWFLGIVYIAGSLGIIVVDKLRT